MIAPLSGFFPASTVPMPLKFQAPGKHTRLAGEGQSAQKQQRGSGRRPHRFNPSPLPINTEIHPAAAPLSALPGWLSFIVSL
jgi:hypothetical protein